MFLWFAGLAFAIVLVVFSSPALDYRLVMVGALLPTVEIALGEAFILHTLLGSVALLTFVMVATIGRRLRRRQWLGLPIGTFMHLVLDGTWATTDLFWWPVLGLDGVLGEAPIPELERSAVVIIAMEAVGLTVLILLIRRFDLLGDGRRRFLTTGQLQRGLMA